MSSPSRQSVCAVLVIHVLITFGVLRAATWRGDNSAAWEFAGIDLWSVAEGKLLQRSPGDTTSGLLKYYVSPKDAVIERDFSLTIRAGFNPEGYPLDEHGTLSWRIYYRTIAFGVMEDSANGLLAVFSRTNGSRNGLLRIAGGREVWLSNPAGGQGVGLDIHDLREYRMSRRGSLVTVWLDGVPVFQAEDTLAALDGRPVVCGPGAAGIAVEELRLERSAEDVAGLEIPATVDSFVVGMENGGGPVLRDVRGRPLGTVELGDSMFGWWTTNSPRDGGGKSWVAAGGQLSVPNFRMASAATIECWFRLVEVPEGGVPILHFAFDGSRIDSAWSGRERGGPMARVFPDSSLGLHFHEFGDGNADLPGIFELGKWTHLAWVRQGAVHRIYVDRREVLSLYLPKYGDRTLTGLQLNVAQNADHDWLLAAGRPYLELNSLRAVPEALEPEEFMAETFPRSLRDEHDVPCLFSLGVPFPNPFSPSLTPTMNIPEGFGEAVVLDVIDREGNTVGKIYSGNIQPGSLTMQWNVSDNAGEWLKSGVYFYRLRSGTEIRLGKLVLLK
ncbi:MAG: hypothetical protein FVQ81_15430 [Candidatus Glassbacteria bacterium]|nr:hypothetical protein [Candidatus Glassbacteria bacterium]